MAKWYGKVGYAETVETAPGVWDEVFTERPYFGDVTSIRRNLQTTGESTNDNITINDVISIVADPYAYDHFYSMRYVEYMGALWKVSSVDATQRPRLILSLGGIYNGAQAGIAE